MTAAEQHELETYRVIVFRRTGAEVLLVQNDGRFLLPSVSIPRWQRVAQNINSALKSEGGEEVVCLFTFDSTSASLRANEIHYQLAEHRQSAATPHAPTHWLDASLLSEDLFFDRADYEAIQRSIAKHPDKALDGESKPFAQLGWFGGLYQWVEAVVEQQGFHLNGSFRQLNASPSFNLIRFETVGPAFWFKAVGEPNQREFPITQTLAELFPGYVPPMVGVRLEWNGWLTREVDGMNLIETQEPTLWTKASARLAELQVASIGHDQEILSAGAHDLSSASLSELVLPFFETVATLMDQQSKIPPPVLTRAELARMGRAVLESLDVLRDIGLPDTLGHLDLNPGNMLVSPRGCIFLDWAEAYVGQPFLSLQYLVEHLRRLPAANPVIESQMVNAYTAAWQGILSPDVISQALDIAPLLAVFAYAAASPGWRHPETLEPAIAAYVRSLTRRIYREANQLNRRRSRCVC